MTLTAAQLNKYYTRKYRIKSILSRESEDPILLLIYINIAYQKEPDVRKKPNKGTCQMDLTTISHLDSD